MSSYVSAELPRTVPRPRRIRRVLKWTCTLLSASILLAAAACLRWRNIYVMLDGTFWAAGVHGGSLALWWADALPQGSLVLDCGPTIASQQERYETWSSFGLSFRRGKLPGGLRFITVPLWMLFVLVGIPTVTLWRLDRRRPLPGHCPRCRYNLTANTSGRCPECGQPVLKSQISNLKS